MAGMKFNADIDLEKIVKLRQEIDKLKKSLIEIASVPNSDAAVKSLERQLASALKKLETYKDKYVQTQQARLDQEKAASEQIKKQQKEIDSLIKKYEALQKQIEKGTLRPPRSPKSYTDEQISAALNTQVQSIKEAREQLKILRFAQANVTDQQEKETGARTKLNIKIQENTRYLKLNSDAYTRQKMEIGNYEENIRRALDGTGQFNLSLSKMLGVIGGTAALKGLVTDMINVRGEFQKTSIAFETMLGSKEKADALMAQMVETAAKTPFDLQGVTSGAKQLLAYGTSADKVNETLVRLGNIASGLSIPLGELVYLYGTSMSQGRLFTQDVNQFMGRGIPLVAELSKELGKTESEIRKMVTEGKVGFPELQKVIENMTNEGGKFYNLMEMQSTTLSGQISNLGDAWDSMLNSIGEETQGIASITISAVTSIIENYKEVGAIIASLVATYGTYKAAIVVVNMLERANIMILRQAVVEKKLAAAANIVLSNSMAIAAARGKIFATVQKNIISTFKGAGKALANPYVLFAAAVGTATYGLYQFYTRETEVEKMQKRYNETKEAAARREEQHKTKVEELINSIEDETQAEMERIGAIELLKKMYPGIIEKYIDEEGHLKNLIALKKELSGTDATRKAEENKTELRSYDERIKNQKEYIERMRTNDQSAVDDEIAKLKRLEEEREVARQKVASDYINKWITDYNSKSDEKLKNTIDTYKKLLSENVQGEWFTGSKDFKVDEIKQFVSALENLQKARLNAVKNKKYWEDKKKEAEDARNALDISKKNSEEWNKYTKQIQEAQKQIDKYSDSKSGKEADKQKKDQQKSAEELLTLRRQNQQDEINLMKEGTEKKLKQIDLDYQKELDAIRKQEKDLSERQGGKLTSEQSIEISARYTNAENKRDKAIADVTKNQLKTEADAMREYLKEYGTFQQKKEAITKEYNDKIANATTEGDKKILQKQMEEALSSVDMDKLKQEINWELIFSDLNKVSKKSLEQVKQQLKTFKNSDEYKNMAVDQKKVIDEALNNIQSTIIDKGGLLGDLPEQLEALRIAQDELKQAQDEYNKSLKSGTDAEKEAALKKKNKAEKNVQNAETNVTRSADKTYQNLITLADTITQLGSSSEMSLSQIGSLASGLIDTFTEAGSKIGGIVGAVFSLLDGIEKQGFDGFVKNVFSSVFGAGASMWNTITFGGFNKLFGIGGNAKEVQDTIDRLTDRNETLQTAIEDLTDVMEASKGTKSVAAYTDAKKLQEETEENYKKIAQEQARYSNSHHSWNYYWGGFNQDEIARLSSQIGRNWNGDIWSLSPEEMKMLRSNVDMWEKIQNTGKGNYGGRLTEKLNDYIDQAGKMEELTNKLYEGLTGISFESMYDSFIDTLMDMDASAEDAADNIADYFMRAMLSNKIGELYSDKLEAWWKKFGKSMEDNELTESEREALQNEYMQYVEEAMKIRDEIAAATGYTGSSSSSSQETSKKGFATASQDSIDELNGRFTSLQIAGEEIKNQNQQQTMSILELKADMLPIIANTSGIKDIASETRDLLRLSYEAIVDIRDNTNVIVKPIQQMASDIAEVKRNTNGLTRK
ncbi:tape measure protein [Bacteroides finegoldii]|uniref:tape measure protein n=1 Tax=Bacteroides finegoldii TaxID=338188 RepID=UPI0026656850|nr:tape measure protein [Bacteroides finegoldii]